MSRRIQVFVGDMPEQVGTLHFEASGARMSAAFEYSPEWLAAPDRFALEPGLPLVAGPQFHSTSKSGSVFHAAIADTEPDGWARTVILRDRAKRRQAARRAGARAQPSPLTELDFLLAVDDLSRAGALRFKDEAGVFQRPNEPGRRTAPPLIELGQLVASSHAVERESETAADLAYLRGRGTSLGGLRPKCSVVDEKGHLSIGKFPSVTDTRAITHGEVLAMRLAVAAGIRSAEARLVDSDGAPVALIRRFDRDAEGGRIPYVSAATLMGVEPADPGPHTYTGLLDALRVHGADVRADGEELWRRIVFNVLITNVDDHLHNHGFLHAAEGRWRLAPAFDVNPFPDRLRELKTWISEEAGPEATLEAALSVAPYFRIPQKRAKEIVGQVEKAVGRWRTVGKALGMKAQDLDAFADAFEHAERPR